jgi:hypothetical protein
MSHLFPKSVYGIWNKGQTRLICLVEIKMFARQNEIKLNNKIHIKQDEQKLIANTIIPKYIINTIKQNAKYNEYDKRYQRTNRTADTRRH